MISQAATNPGDAAGPIHTSKYELMLTDTTSSLTEFVLKAASEKCSSPAAPALVDGPSGRVISYGELKPMIRSCAAGLHSRGLAKGGVLAILSPNIPEYAIAFHAAASLGAKVTTINPVYTVHEVTHQLKDAGADFLITTSMFAEKSQEAAAASSGTKVKRIYLFDGTEVDDQSGNTPVTSYKALLADGDGAFPSGVTIDPSDVVAIPYSSGTSGLPKGVMLTHFNLVSHLQQISSVHLRLSSDDSLVGVLPFFHIYGMMMILNLAITCGAKTVTLPKFDPPLFLKVLKGHGVTVAHVAPPLVGFLAKHPAVDSVLPLPKLRELFSGAAPLGGDLAAAAMKRLDVATIRQGYGMTEMSPASHIHPYDSPFEKIGGVGTLVPGMTCKVVSTETGLPVGVGERGELWLAGPNIMAGYLNNAKETAETIDSDGFLHTGDVGYVDADGYYFIVDRVKELIKVKGFQVAPAELEALLLASDAIGDAAVIGVSDAKSGEAPKAFVVKQAGHEGLTEDEVKAFVKGKVAVYKEIGFVDFVEKIPKSAAGKILRKDLRKMEEDARGAAAGVSSEGDGGSAAAASCGAADTAATTSVTADQQQSASSKSPSRRFKKPPKPIDAPVDLNSKASTPVCASPGCGIQ